MSVKLKNGPVCGFTGKPIKILKRDANGDAIAVKGTDTYEIEDANTVTLIKHILLTLHINTKIQAQVDSFNMADAWSQLDFAKDDVLELKDETYKWIHRVLNRVVPKTDEEKKQFVEQQIFIQALFSGDAYTVKKALWKIDGTPDSLTAEASV